MADPVNYLIGRGESLVQPIALNSGGGEKSHPYGFDEALERLTPQLDLLTAEVDALPRLACPADEAVVALTLHPAYLAKSYHPSRLLNGLGLRQVGSREQRVLPDKWTRKTPPDGPLIAPQLFVAGPRRRLASLRQGVLASEDAGIFDDFRRIEHVMALGDERLRSMSGRDPMPPVEVVLHADPVAGWGEEVIRGFWRWCESLGIATALTHRQHAGGLSFIGMHAQRDRLADLSRFAFLRTIRRMPKLAFRDMPLRAAESPAAYLLALPDETPVDTGLRIAILDGGLPPDHQFPSHVVARDAPGVGTALFDGIRHGAQVTSALLYGHLPPGRTPPKPYAGVDHWRVLDADGDDFQLMTTLDRIMDVLEQHRYEIVNISIGPDEAMLDDDVHVWTSRLDQFAAAGSTLIITAAGNNGEFDQASGLCRIQPAADGVNVMAVGAADRSGGDWVRAPYSARGPGRSPGLVKPDVLAFGGSVDEMFYAADGTGAARGVFGTSFAGPNATRLGVGLKALFGSQLNPMAIKALLVHQADGQGHAQGEVGWGRLPAELDDLATCAPDEATVVYQGLLEPARYRRFHLPVPAGGFRTRPEIRATFVAATAVDPEDAINYTRTGVGITFRPRTVGHPGWYRLNGELRERTVHESRPFFGKSAIFETEQTLRDDAQRWESVLRASNRFLPTTLDQPVFDIEHLARANGQAAPRSDAVSYALVVSIREKNSTDLYNRIIRSYVGRLEAMRPQVEIPIRARNG